MIRYDVNAGWAPHSLPIWVSSGAGEALLGAASLGKNTT